MDYYFDTLNFPEDLPPLSSNQSPLKQECQSSSSMPLMFQNYSNQYYNYFDKPINIFPPNGSNFNPSQSFEHFSAGSSSSIPFSGVPTQSFGSDHHTNYLWNYNPQPINQTQQLPNEKYHIYPSPLSINNFQGLPTHHVHNGCPTDHHVFSWITQNDYQKRSVDQIKKTRVIRKVGKGSKNFNIIKGQWTPQEDKVLLKLVERYGEKKWAQIANTMKGRIGKQCRERWHNHLRPHIRKDTWSEEEEKILIEAHKEMGNKWAEIARRLPGRTENTIKNHWNAARRRQISRNKNNKHLSNNNSSQVSSSSSSSSLLHNYIKSLNMNSSSSILTVSNITNPPTDHDDHDQYNKIEMMNNITTNTGVIDSSDVSYSGYQWEDPMLFNEVAANNIGVISNQDESYDFRPLFDQELMPSVTSAGIYEDISSLDFEIENQVNQGMDLLEMIISQGNSKF